MPKTTPRHSNLKKELIIGTTVSLIGSITIGIINYLIRRTLALNLEISEYGYVYTIISLLSLILAFTDLGLSKALSIQAAPLYAQQKYDHLKSLFSVAFITKLLIGILIAIVLTVSYPILENIFHYQQGHPIFMVFLLWFICTNCLGVSTAFLEASQNFLLKNVFLFIRYFTTLLFILFTIDSLGPLAAAIAFSLGELINLIVTLLYFKMKQQLSLHISTYSISLMAQMFHYAKWIALSIAGLSAMPHIDTLMLTYFHGTQLSGEYNIVLPIVQIIQSMFVFSTVFIPIASKLWSTQKTDQLARILQITTLGLSILFTMGCTLIFFQGPQIISVLFRPDYAYLSPIALLLCIGISLFLLGQIHLDTLNIAEKSKLSAKIMAIGIITNIICNLTLIPKYKLLGAAIATSISYLTIFILASKSTTNLFLKMYNTPKISRNQT